MPKFLTTSDITHFLEDLAISAESSVLLVSPLLKFSDKLLQELIHANNKGKKITIIYSKDELTKTQRNFLWSLNNAEIFYCSVLNSICYSNGNRLLISSMEQLRCSAKNIRSFGILMECKQDAAMFRDVMKEIESIKKSSVKQKQFTPRENFDEKKDDYRTKQNLTENYFHLPLLKTYLTLKYPGLKFTEDQQNHSIELKKFPKENISISINGRVEINFDSQYEYNQVELWRDQFENKFSSEVKISWDNKKISIYKPMEKVDEQPTKRELKAVEFYFNTIMELAEIF